MEDFNIYGWSAIHEASYKGYSNAVSRFINYARDTQKMYLLELKTIDDLKATPLLIAALGGHLECVKILIDSGASLGETIKYRGKYFHGCVEIATIRQDMNVMMYFYENFNSSLKVCERICNLMKNEENDDEIRASISRTLELITDKDHENLKAKLRDELLSCPDFGKIFTSFVKQSRKNDESLASCVLIMLNVFHVNLIRDFFNKNNGISYLIESLNGQNQVLRQELTQYSKVTSDGDTLFRTEDVLKSLDVFENCNLIVASLGKAFAELSKHADSTVVIVNESYGEKLIEFVRLLFDSNALFKRYVDEAVRLRLNRHNKLKKTILFEQYIHPYIQAIGNIVQGSEFYKSLFNQSHLYECVLNVWFMMHPVLAHSSHLDSRPSSNSSNYYKVSKSHRSSNVSVLPKISSTRASLNIDDQKKKFVPFEFVPLKYNNETAASSIIEPAMTPSLVKLLKLSIIECIGKVLCENPQLKKAYFYSQAADTGSFKYLNKNKNWPNITMMFINCLIDYLDANRSIEKEVRLEVMQFLANLFRNDNRAIEKLVDFAGPSKSSLVICLRNLIRKSVAITLREEAMRTIWSIVGADDMWHTQKEKLVFLKAIGTQKFVDCICDSDYLSLIALKALEVIASGPPFREAQRKQERLINGPEEVKRVHGIPSIIRLLKVKNEEALLCLLKAISVICVTTGYENNYRNQLAFANLGTIPVINELCQKRVHVNKRLKYEAYMTLSSLALNNNVVRKLVYRNFTHDILGLIHTLLTLLLAIDEGHLGEEAPQLTLDDNELDKIQFRIKAGMALAAFCYRNDEFRDKLVLEYDKIPWTVFAEMLDYLLMQENLNKSTRSISDKYIRVVRLKCLLAFQMTALYGIIDSRRSKIVGEEDDNGENDPRAVGIKILIDLVQYSTNSYIRTLAADCICRLINTDRTLVEPLVTVDAVEILCRQLEFENSPLFKTIRGNEITENEIGNCSITLAHLIEFSPEARRRIIKLARKTPNIMRCLKYYNKSLHMDLLEHWEHYEKLMFMVNKKQPLNRKPDRFLPLINNEKKSKIVV